MARMLGKRMPDLEDNLIIASGDTADVDYVVTSDRRMLETMPEVCLTPARARAHRDPRLTLHTPFRYHIEHCGPHATLEDGMADNEALFTPELVFLIGSARRPPRCLRDSKANLPRAATSAPVGSTPSARARMPIPRALPCRRPTSPSHTPTRVCGQALYRGGKARRARDVQCYGRHGCPCRRRSSSIWVLPSRAARSRPCKRS